MPLNDVCKRCKILQNQLAWWPERVWSACKQGGCQIFFLLLSCTIAFVCSKSSAVGEPHSPFACHHALSVGLLGQMFGALRQEGRCAAAASAVRWEFCRFLPQAGHSPQSYEISDSFRTCIAQLGEFRFFMLGTGKLVHPQILVPVSVPDWRNWWHQELRCCADPAMNPMMGVPDLVTWHDRFIQLHQLICIYTIIYILI